MEQNPAPTGGQECAAKPSSTTPAYFVILHNSKGDDSKEEGILVANRDMSSVAPIVSMAPDKSKSEIFLSADCVSKEITVTLDNNNLWNEFYRCKTEMVLTKQGRRMFPYCRYWITGLDPQLKYILVMDITPLDTHRYKWNGKWWEPGSKAEPHVLGRVFIHPESPSTGQYWMHQPISFYKLKLTNNVLDQDGHIILHSMHRYLPRLHVVPAEKATEVIELNGPDVHTFTFPQTEFIAVTAYQNFQITQLKIDCNPFAKGFREGAVIGRFSKDPKQKHSEQDSKESKTSLQHDDPESIQKLRELFRMSEHSDVEAESEALKAEHESKRKKKSRLNADKIDSFVDHSGTPFVPIEPKVEIKEEPEDYYDYNKPVFTGGVTVKREESEDEVTDEYSNSDNDNPILERHFAQLKADALPSSKRSLENNSGVAKAKLLKLGNSNRPMVVLQSRLTDKSSLVLSNLQETVLAENTKESTKGGDAPIKMETLDTPIKMETFPISVSSNVFPKIEEDVSKYGKKHSTYRKSKDKSHVKCDTPKTTLSNTHGPKKKLPFLLPKASVAEMPGNETPIVKKRGRPRKHNVSKVGRPTKKGSPIEAPRLCPDFNPDLEDVDGVLFVAFSSKEALDVHTGGKPKTVETPSFPPQPETEEGRKIAQLERQLLAHLKTMRYRQVIHPALQQVGLKLNIVDVTMSIDLRYLGVQLPLPRFTNGTRWDCYGFCTQGFPFVSRTGKTTDYKQIKGWRDKFSTNTTESSVKIEGSRTESVLKNRSAFCSDELDEYLENEAKLMGDIKALTEMKPVSTISYQLPTKSSSYVRTLDSVLKKQATQAPCSTNAVKAPPLPTPKRKYTRRAIPASQNLKPILPSPVTVKEKLCKAKSTEEGKRKPRSTEKSKTTNSTSEKHPATSENVPKQKDTVQHKSTKLHQSPLQRLQLTAKPLGSSTPQMKLQGLEEGAIRMGNPRTFITEERADFALSALLTAQASLKSKPTPKMTYKQTTQCNKEFCHLGCICSSLHSMKLQPTHCYRTDCMFGCNCLKSKLYLCKDGFKIKSTKSMQENAEGEDCLSFVNDDCSDNPSAEKKEESHLPTPEESNQNCKNLELRSSKYFPIWDKSDVDNDPEPLCIPEYAEFDKPDVLHHKQHLERSKSSAGKKSSRLHTSRTAVPVKEMDPVYKYFDDMMTCARVRAYEPKAPNESPKIDQCIYDASDTSRKEHGQKSYKPREQDKEDPIEDEVVCKRRKKGDSGPTKPIEIMSDHSLEQDQNKNLNIISPHKNSREHQSFQVGSLNIELISQNKTSDNAMSSTTSSRMKISMTPDLKTNQVAAKPRIVVSEVESVKPPDQKPLDASSETEAKSHGGKGLPFYTKALPAGKLVAHRKNSTIEQSDLVQVNGKGYPQAKLLLGQMGALHPANRLAAYITHRLRPSLFHLSKLNKNVKMADKSPTDEPSKEPLAAKNSDTSLKSKTASQSTAKKTFAKFVIGQIGTKKISSPEPTVLGSSKLTTQPTRLVLVTSPSGKKAPVVAYSSSGNMTSLSPPSLSISSIRNQTASSPPTLIPLTKDPTLSSTPLQPVTSVPSTKTSPISLSALVKALSSTVTTSTVTLTSNAAPGKVVKSLIMSTNLPANGSIAPATRTIITPPMTLKTVTPLSVQTQRPAGGATPGSEKRLGPRLLLIPVPTSSASVRPAQTIQTSPGQKMVLQPIRNANGANLFRHPNGQIIQLVPLQQVQTGKVQSSGQQVVIRKPGPTMGIRLPLPTKREITSPTSAVAVSPSKMSTVPIITIPKTSPVKSGVTIVSSNLPVLSQLGSPTLKTDSSPTTSNVSVSLSKEVAPTSDGQGVITSNLSPLQSGSFSILNGAGPSASQTVSPPKSSIILMIDKPASAKDANKDKLPDDVLSPGASASSDKQSEEEIAKHVAQREVTQYKKKLRNGKPPNKQRRNDRSKKKVYVEESSDSDEVQSPTHNQRGRRLVTRGDIDPDEQTESTACVEAKEERDKAIHTLLLEQSTAIPDSSASTTKQEKKGNLPVDPLPKISTAPETDKDLTDSYSEDESEADDFDIDIETVEEMSQRMNRERLKAPASTINTDKSGTQSKFSKGLEKGNEDDTYSGADDGNLHTFHRKNHTANERKRRHEMRDLFEELKNALGLHNLPKASKSYILNKAIDEIEGLTDSADSLIRIKTSLSLKQSELIKKLSNLSGKPKEAVLKKLEYVYAMQKAVESESKTQDVAEDFSTNSPSPKRTALPPLRLEEEEAKSSAKHHKPIILTRKKVLLPVEKNTAQQPDVSNSSLLMETPGQVRTDNSPTLIQTDPNPAQMHSGPMVIQLPDTVLGNASVPMTLYALPGTIAAETPSHTESEMDDLSMMPKIVNVTSLANESSTDLGRELGIVSPANNQSRTSDAHTEAAVSVHEMSDLTSVSRVMSSSILLNSAQLSFPNVASPSADSSLVHQLPMSDLSSNNDERSAKSQNLHMNDPSFGKLSEFVKDSELEFELKKLSSAMDAGLDSSVLNVIGDHDTDESLTSLLNEIAFLNQQLSTDDLDSGSDFPGPEATSRKFPDGDSSPFSFGRYKGLSETKDSLSPLFLQLEDGEIQESIKHNEDGSIVVYDDATKEPLINVVNKQCGLQKPPVTLTPCQKPEKPVTSTPEVFWKPMPKLAPLGLKSPILSSDHKLSMSMPTLASVATRLRSPKTTD